MNLTIWINSFIDLRSILACRSPSDKIPSEDDSSTFDIVVTNKICMSFSTIPNDEESMKLYDSVYMYF